MGTLDGTPSDEDMILSRILRLNVLDAQNANSMQRYIYIHGTNHEALLGEPSSHGCIRMANADIVELFYRIELGAPLFIGY